MMEMDIQHSSLALVLLALATLVSVSIAAPRTAPQVSAEADNLSQQLYELTDKLNELAIEDDSVVPEDDSKLPLVINVVNSEIILQLSRQYFQLPLKEQFYVYHSSEWIPSFVHTIITPVYMQGLSESLSDSQIEFMLANFYRMTLFYQALYADKIDMFDDDNEDEGITSSSDDDDDDDTDQKYLKSNKIYELFMATVEYFQQYRAGLESPKSANAELFNEALAQRDTIVKRLEAFHAIGTDVQVLRHKNEYSALLRFIDDSQYLVLNDYLLAPAPEHPTQEQVDALMKSFAEQVSTTKIQTQNGLESTMFVLPGSPTMSIFGDDF